MINVALIFKNENSEESNSSMKRILKAEFIVLKREKSCQEGKNYVGEMKRISLGKRRLNYFRRNSKFHLKQNFTYLSDFFWLRWREVVLARKQSKM